VCDIFALTARNYVHYVAKRRKAIIQ